DGEVLNGWQLDDEVTDGSSMLQRLQQMLHGLSGFLTSSRKKNAQHTEHGTFSGPRQWTPSTVDGARGRRLSRRRARPLACSMLLHGLHPRASGMAQKLLRVFLSLLLQ